MEKRRHERIENQHILADLSDGTGFFTGTVKDFSRFGLLLDDVPKRLDETSAQMSVVIQNATESFKFKAKTRWTKKQAVSKMIGFEIVDAPWGWAEFVIKNEDEPKDTIGKITL